ncbi:MAG TPA: aryl sulfotransferase [Chloroflexi bacterium]|nr:aryl sulfotransferase [Chloroflexota bacterium]HCU99152.1 aryl sulfotransferase [Chloroflexota bacterium]|tara:strand:+ start:591 stop:1721 length:1131 start_codon:yes stop_codon:yes gene_type:complete
MNTTESHKLDQVTQRRRGCGLIGYNEKQSAGGYTLFAPATSNGKVFLIDMQGHVVHTWQMPYPPGRHAVILQNGNLGYNGRHPDSPNLYTPWAIWHGGIFLEATPSGEIVWQHTDLTHHHDAQWLNNGNILYGAVEKLNSKIESKINGGHTKLINKTKGMYGDVVKEIDRNGKIVWEWKSWEHLNIEDFSIHPDFERTHWPYINGLWLTSNDIVLMSLRVTSGIIGVNKKSHKVVLHIPKEIVSHQHSPMELHNGNILIFDNGNFRENEAIAYSKIIEYNPYTKKIDWEYTDPVAPSFYSSFQGASQRLSNGNTHITDSVSGRLFEITKSGEVVWEYIIPYFGEYTDPSIKQYVSGYHNSVFRSYRYSKSEIPWLS